MTTKTKKRTKKFRNGKTWKNVSLKEHRSPLHLGGLYGNNKRLLLEADATGVEKDNTILIAEFIGGVQQLADDQHLSNADFIEAAGMMLNALEKAMDSEINDSPSQLDSLAEEIKTDERYTTMGVLNRPHLDQNRDVDFRFSKVAVESHLKDQRHDRADRSVGVKGSQAFTESILYPSSASGAQFLVGRKLI